MNRTIAARRRVFGRERLSFCRFGVDVLRRSPSLPNSLWNQAGGWPDSAQPFSTPHCEQKTTMDKRSVRRLLSGLRLYLSSFHLLAACAALNLSVDSLQPRPPAYALSTFQ